MRIRGFTLVELLVALFITAILFTLGYGAVNQALAHRGELEEQQARMLAVQSTMRVLAQDFGQIAPRPVREPIGDTWQPALVSAATGSAQSQIQSLVSFTRTGWANPAGIQRPALQRVSYTFEKNALRRIYWPVLDTTLGNEPTQRDLLTGVKSVTLRFMEPSRQWADHWPIQPANPNDPGQTQRERPLAVEVTLELDDWGRIVRVFELPQ